METIDSASMHTVQEILNRSCALSFSSGRMPKLTSAVSERLRATGAGSGMAYCELVQRDPEELSELIEAATTKETSFFRVPAQFQAFSELVVPAIEERLAAMLRPGSGARMSWGQPVPLRVWSAACATGEEPYSIAMTLLANLRYPRAWQVEVLASDISARALQHAMAGRYPAEAASRIPDALGKAYIERENGHLTMHASLRERLRFRQVNLACLSRLPGTLLPMSTITGTSEVVDVAERFECIFCRNVLIYFDSATQERLVVSLFNALRPGGYLFTGDSEPLHLYQHAFRIIEHHGAFLYQRPATGEQP